jgi:hypothetical protein
MNIVQIVTKLMRLEKNMVLLNALALLCCIYSVNRHMAGDPYKNWWLFLAALNAIGASS